MFFYVFFIAKPCREIDGQEPHRTDYMKYQFLKCELDIARHELLVDGLPRKIEPQVFHLLVYLIDNRERVVSKDELVNAIWEGRIISDAAISSRISGARHAVGDDGKLQNIIRTVPRLGFRFVADVAIEDSAPPPGQGEDAGRILLPGGETRAAVEGMGIPPLPQKPTLAVLPFSSLGGDPDHSYLPGGITEDIITALSKNRWLLVLARNATISFRDQSLPPIQIANSIGADYLVSGSVRRDGDRIRINVQLIDGQSGTHVWVEKYDRSIHGIFDLQDEITETIAARIAPELETAERKRVKHKHPQSLNAWDQYLLGLAQFYTFRKEGNAQAQILFRHAIKLDADFAQAHARLAYSMLLSMVYFDSEPDPALLDEALETAQKALAIDEQDAVAHFALGRIHLARGDYAKAILDLENSVDLNPCLAPSYCGLGDALTYSGRLDEAIAQFEIAIRLSPYDPYRWAFFSYRSLAHLFLGEYEAAVEWAEKATQIPNAQYWPHAHFVAALGYLERPEKTLAAVEALLNRKPEFTRDFARQHLFYIQKEEQMKIYLEGLQRAGIPK